MAAQKFTVWGASSSFSLEDVLGPTEDWNKGPGSWRWGSNPGQRSELTQTQTKSPSFSCPFLFLPISPFPPAFLFGGAGMKPRALHILNHLPGSTTEVQLQPLKSRSFLSQELTVKISLSTPNFHIGQVQHRNTEKNFGTSAPSTFSINCLNLLTIHFSYSPAFKNKTKHKQAVIPLYSLVLQIP